MIMNRSEFQKYILMIIISFILFFVILFLCLKISNTPEAGGIGLLLGFILILIISFCINPIVFKDYIKRVEERQWQEKEEVEK